jgi:hypothetical protein
MRNGQPSRNGKSNLNVMPTPKGNSPQRVPLQSHNDLKNGHLALPDSQLTLQNMAKKDSMEQASPQNSRKAASAAKSDNMSVTSQQLNRLTGLPGHKILTYMRSPLFGQHGESTRLVDIIQVSTF